MKQLYAKSILSFKVGILVAKTVFFHYLKKVNIPEIIWGSKEYLCDSKNHFYDTNVCFIFRFWSGRI